MPGQASNPVTVFVLPSIEAVQRLYRNGDGANKQDIAGFYVPRANGSIAFTPKHGSGDGNGDLTSQIVLFHEYAHHMLLGNSTIAYPAWFSEGYAEFVSTTRIDKDSAMVGVAAQHRAYSLFATTGITIERLFDPRRKPSSVEQEAVYARGWLLTHYLIFDADRMRKFGEYLKLLNNGTPPVQAATKAFGDLKQLNRELDKYLGNHTIPGLKVPFAVLPPVKVDVRSLTPGARAMMSYRIQSKRGVDDETAKPLWAKAAVVAAANPADAMAQGWFAEMAFDAQHDDEAEAAADRALAVDPTSVQALLYKARVHLRRAQAAKSTNPKTWTEARSWIIKANRLDSDNAAPLELFYWSFEMEHRPPTKSAADGLARAFELVPQDTGLRMSMVRQKLADNDLVGARTTLRPIAYDPHSDANGPAVKLLAMLDAATDPVAAAAAMDALGKGDAKP